MDGKIVAAFLVGAVVASGIVYMSVRPGTEAKTAKIAEASPQAVAPAPVPTAQATVEPPTLPAGSLTPEPPRPVVHAPVREKPSPMPPPIRRQRPVEIAREQAPTPPPPVSSLPQPAPETRAPDARPASPPPSSPAFEQRPIAPVEPTPAPDPPAVLAAPAASTPDIRVPHTVTVDAGTMLPVRIGETISSARNQVGDSFLATLDHELVLDGFVIAERGSRVEGRIVELEPAGRTRGISHLGIELVRLSTSDGQRVRIRTEAYKKDGPISTGGDAAKVGAGAAIGAAIGAIAGGGKGAAIGAGVGGAAGVGDVLLTRGKPAEIPVETRLTFRVREAVSITEKLD